MPSEPLAKTHWEAGHDEPEVEVEESEVEEEADVEDVLQALTAIDLDETEAAETLLASGGSAETIFGNL